MSMPLLRILASMFTQAQAQAMLRWGPQTGLLPIPSLMRPAQYRLRYLLPTWCYCTTAHTYQHQEISTVHGPYCARKTTAARLELLVSLNSAYAPGLAMGTSIKGRFPAPRRGAFPFSPSRSLSLYVSRSSRIVDIRFRAFYDQKQLLACLFSTTQPA